MYSSKRHQLACAFQVKNNIHSKAPEYSNLTENRHTLFRDIWSYEDIIRSRFPDDMCMLFAYVTKESTTEDRHTKGQPAQFYQTQPFTFFRTSNSIIRHRICPSFFEATKLWLIARVRSKFTYTKIKARSQQY